ncbi:Transcription termination factor MTEF18, mitochondrial [Vitis vinifera]|uniref:Transcription termination factor MTEF18, mitochondrial n=1 Tax=Vitis vinifera TaxID=29760 RepID=A0A438HBM9_VITVI|nr:Transcription termination factor MTEF18, mitochondrial [Vitis vinifera]
MADALGDSGFKLSSIFPESLVSRLHQCEMLSDSSQQNPIYQAFIRSSDFLQFPRAFSKASFCTNPSSVLLRIQPFCCSTPAYEPKLWSLGFIHAHFEISTWYGGNHKKLKRLIIRTPKSNLSIVFALRYNNLDFHLTDAEHMSKNSPHFLQKLLSKVENEQDVARSLSKFLRYNPINEFEPFFESLENYHVLCDYGIARSSIGRMYKEVQAIFRYELGLLGSKVRAYEGLGLSRSTVIKLVSCCPWLLVGGVNSQFVMVLKRVKGLGFESDWIGGYLSGKAHTIGKECMIQLIFLRKWDIVRSKWGRGDQLQERFDCLVQAGLDCNVVSNMIKQAPSVLNQTKYVIEKKIDCLRNCLGYPLQSVVAFPSYLCYDIERINLRFSMYVWLRDKGAAKSNLSLSTILACSDARFVKYL